MKPLYISFWVLIICTQINIAQSKIEHISWSSEDGVIQINYPLINDTAPIFGQLNKLIKDSINQWKKDFELAFELHLKEPTQQIDSDEEWMFSWYMSIGGYLSYLDENYVSLSFSIHDKRAEINTYKSNAFNFKLKNQRLEPLSLKDMIKDEKKFPFIVWETMLKQNANSKNKYRFLKTNLEAQMDAFNFYAQGINLNLKFNSDSSDEEPLYGEINSVFIEWNVLKEIISPEIKKQIIDKFPNINLKTSYIQNVDTLVKAEKIKAKISKTNLKNLPNAIYPSEIKYKALTDTLQFKSWYERPQFMENYHIKDKNPHFKREGINLKLLLKNDKFHMLTDDTSYSSAFKSYHYVDFIEDVNHHLIAVSYWEGARYLLIRGDTGEELYLNGIPLFSPNHQYFLTTAYGIGYVYNTTELNIWEIQSDKTRLIGKFSFDIHLGNPWMAQWQLDKTILLELMKYGDCEKGEDQYCKEIIQMDIY